MRRFLLLLSTGLLLAGGSAHAQLGLRLGGSLARFRSTDVPSVSTSSTPQLGYQLGVTYQLPLTERLRLVPEVQYSSEHQALAQATSPSDVYFTGDYHLRLDYLNVPVLLRLNLGRVYLEAGPQASLLLGGRQTGTLTTYAWSLGYTTSTTEVDRALGNDYQRLDAGPCAGIGLQLFSGLGLSLRAYQSLVTLNRDQAAAYGAYHRQAWQASVTYQFKRS